MNVYTSIGTIFELKDTELVLTNGSNFRCTGRCSTYTSTTKTIHSMGLELKTIPNVRHVLLENAPARGLLPQQRAQPPVTAGGMRQIRRYCRGGQPAAERYKKDLFLPFASLHCLQFGSLLLFMFLNY